MHLPVLLPLCKSLSDGRVPAPIPLHIAGHKVDPPVSGVSPWFLSSRTPRAGVGQRIPESIAVATAENHLTAFGLDHSRPVFFFFFFFFFLKKKFFARFDAAQHTPDGGE